MKQQVHGNVTGVRDTLIEALGQLYDYEVDEDTFLPRELMQVLARFTGVLNREIAVYITRDGEVVDVSIGTDRDVELRDYRLRRNTQRLSCVRCIHTHPNGDGRLSDVDLSALRSFRYDAMVAIGCLKGEPTFVQSAFLVEKQNLLMDEPVRWYKTPDGDWMRQITESDRIVGWEADEKGTHVKERAVLMGIESMESLDELARLADTAGAEVVGQFLQKKDKPDTALFIGRGRADELCRQCQALEADLCIFDEELTGIQARNLEEILRVKVVDRTTLILDIFAQRASSAEGKLQVELAQLQYQSSRLIGQGLVLSRLAGGIGTRGGRIEAGNEPPPHPRAHDGTPPPLGCGGEATRTAPQEPREERNSRRRAGWLHQRGQIDTAEPDDGQQCVCARPTVRDAGRSQPPHRDGGAHAVPAGGHGWVHPQAAPRAGQRLPLDAGRSCAGGCAGHRQRRRIGGNHAAARHGAASAVRPRRDGAAAH